MEVVQGRTRLDLRQRLGDLDLQHEPASWMRSLATDGFDQLPQPGSGQTLQRWQALAEVASHDLSLAKLYEGHTDALAILRELNCQLPHQPPHQLPLPDAMPSAVSAPAVWGVWAADVPSARVVIQPDHSGDPAGDDRVRISGLKCWCSGAESVTHGLLTAWHADGRGPQLVAVSMQQAGISVRSEAWQAVGMCGSASVDLMFDGAQAQLVGKVGDYLARPGFWQGGAGIAACWHGGALFLASTLLRAYARSAGSEGQSSQTAFRGAALGRVDIELRANAALLREAAQWIDAHPAGDASEIALRVRLRAESAAKAVLESVGAALGASPFCSDARFARMAADLPVFIRQSHAERDFAALGELVGRGGIGGTGGAAWTL